jgi:hypothetical protein
MARNPRFTQLLTTMAVMHDKKNEDYASAANPYSNFEFAGRMAAPFTDPVDIAFATLIGVKLARLAELKGKGRSPQNESVADTQLDLAVYAALWCSYGMPFPAEAPARPASLGDQLAAMRHTIQAVTRPVTTTPVAGGLGGPANYTYPSGKVASVLTPAGEAYADQLDTHRVRVSQERTLLDPEGY